VILCPFYMSSALFSSSPQFDEVNEVWFSGLWHAVRVLLSVVSNVIAYFFAR
jgi:hypothetical protein